MKVLIISDAWHPQVNGVVRTYEYLATELEKSGHEVKVIGPADFPVRLPMPGYSEIKLALFPFKRLSQMIAEFNPGNIHIATEGPLGWAARRYCMQNKLDFTTSYHTHFPHYAAKRVKKFAPFLYPLIHKLGILYVSYFHAPAKTVLVATQSLGKELQNWGFKSPMHRFSRGVNLDLFHPGEKNLFHDLPKPIALYVGRVAIEKSVEDFLSLKWGGSKIIVGDGPSLTHLAQKYPDAHFVGTKTGKDLADHYRSADIFVFPSRTDTFGMVLVEALACGLPVAAYNVTGPKDIITEDFLGALTTDNLAQAAHKALRHSDAPARFAHVQQNYTWEAAARQFAETLTS